jgi:hypothetical protein
VTFTPRGLRDRSVEIIGEQPKGCSRISDLALRYPLSSAILIYLGALCISEFF